MSLSKVDLIALLSIREMTERKCWVTPDEVHRMLGLCGIHKPTPPADPMMPWSEWDEMRTKSLRLVVRLVAGGFVYETQTHEFGHLWECLRLTRKGHAQVKGFRVPAPIAETLASVSIPPLFGNGSKIKQPVMTRQLADHLRRTGYGATPIGEYFPQRTDHAFKLK